MVISELLWCGSSILSVCDAGRHSWSTASRGSWFIESLCHELKEAVIAGGIIDIEQVLARARFHVAYNQETSSSNKTLCGKKQMPSVYTTLTKQLHFPCLHWTSLRLFVCTIFLSVDILSWLSVDVCAVELCRYCVAALSSTPSCLVAL